MTNPTAQQIAAIKAVADALTDAVNALPNGAPGGHLYAAVMGHMDLSTFQAIMRSLVAANRIARRGECYFPVAR